jgi:hypothetical protein
LSGLQRHWKILPDAAILTNSQSAAFTPASLRISHLAHGRIVAKVAQGGEQKMKYLLAWLLGVPGGLIVLWFLFNHMH